MSTDNGMTVYGIKADGTEVLLGHFPTTPSGDDDDCSDANSCLWALEQYHEWLVSQGWTGPAVNVNPQPKGD